MKALIKFLLILLVGMILGYVFHDPIDTKLKAKFGNEKVEKAKQGVENGVDVGKKALKKGGEVISEAIDSIKDSK